MICTLRDQRQRIIPASLADVLLTSNINAIARTGKKDDPGAMAGANYLYPDTCPLEQRIKIKINKYKTADRIM